MAQPSSLHPLSGPLAGKHLEFDGTDVMIGSAADCAVRIDAPGVEAHHARIVIDAIGATIYRGDGPVGVNDDLVTEDARLRSGDFVWIGEPGGEHSLMLQFTLGDGPPAPVPALVEGSFVEAGPAEGELMEEMASEDLAPAAAEGIDDVLVEEAPAPFEPASEVPEALEPALEFEAPHEEPEPFEAPVEHAEMMEAHEPEPLGEIEASFDEPAPFTPPVEASAPSSASSPKVPPAPWQMAAAPEPAPALADYASAWESPAKPAAPEPAVAPAPPPPPPRPTPPPAPRPAPAAVGAGKRPATPSSARGKADALRAAVPPPPARTTSSTPMIVGGLVAVLLLAAGGAYFLTSGSPEPAPPAPTPGPTAVAVATPPPVAPGPTLEAPPPESAAAPPVTTAPPPTAGAPTPRAAPTPRTTPTPGRPAAGAPAVATPVPAAVAAAPAAPAATPVPKLLEEARAAIVAKDLAKAAQLFDQALKAEPTNSAATAGKAEVAARLAALSRKFAMAATNTLGGKAAKGPTGFDLGGGAAVKADISGQVRCTTTPAVVEPGMKFALKCSLLNIGAKGFKIAEVTGSETVDNAARGSGPGEGSTPKQELAPRAEVVIFEKSGSWSASNSWRLEILVKTNKDESFRSAYTWR